MYTYPSRLSTSLGKLLTEQATQANMAGFDDRASRVPYRLEDMWTAPSSPLGDATEACVVMYAQLPLPGADLMNDYYRPMSQCKTEWSYVLPWISTYPNIATS